MLKALAEGETNPAALAALREVSRRLHSIVRSYDVVGRYGGEEFLVVLNKCDPASALAPADNVRNAIGSKAILLGGIH